MKPEHKRQYIALGDLADEWGRESALSRAQLYELVLAAMWRGEFEDGRGQTSLFLLSKVHPRDTIELNRLELGRRMCGIGAWRRPLTGLKSYKEANGLSFDDTEATFEFLAGASLTDYDDEFRRIYLDPLQIERGAFLQWCLREGIDPPAFWFSENERPTPKAGRDHGPAVSERDLRAFLRPRHVELPAEVKRPTIKEDWDDSRIAFPNNKITRQRVIGCRRPLIPLDEAKPGPRKARPTRP